MRGNAPGDHLTGSHTVQEQEHARGKSTAMDALDEWLRWAIGGLVFGLLGLWRVINGKADKTELIAYMAEARVARDAIHSKLDDVSKATQQTAVCLAKIEGRLNGK
jgi:hypothetical protein